jgi:hypothetical protein
VTGEVSLKGARIGGILDLEEATLTNMDGLALSADGLTVVHRAARLRSRPSGSPRWCADSTIRSSKVRAHRQHWSGGVSSELDRSTRPAWRSSRSRQGTAAAPAWSVPTASRPARPASGAATRQPATSHGPMVGTWPSQSTSLRVVCPRRPRRSQCSAGPRVAVPRGPACRLAGARERRPRHRPRHPPAPRHRPAPAADGADRLAHQSASGACSPNHSRSCSCWTSRPTTWTWPAPASWPRPSPPTGALSWWPARTCPSFARSASPAGCPWTAARPRSTRRDGHRRQVA